MRIFVLIVWSLFAWALGLGCRPSSGSDINSLDNLSAGRDVKLNVCWADAAGRRTNKTASLIANSVRLDKGVANDGAKAKKLHGEVTLALTAVPEPILKMFAASGGSILLTDDPGAQCTRIFDKDPIYKKLYTKHAPDSCFVLGANEARGGRQSLEIVLKANPTAIRHGLVRQFGFVYSQLFLRMNFVASNGMQNIYTLKATESPAIVALKGMLSEAYMRDVMRSKIFKLNHVLDAVGKEGSGPQRAARIQDYVFAEAFDSYFCNSWAPFDEALATRIQTGKEPLKSLNKIKNSRRIMAKLFPETYKVFRDNVAATVLKGKGATARGLALQDEGGMSESAPEQSAPEQSAPEQSAPEQSAPDNSSSGDGWLSDGGNGPSPDPADSMSPSTDALQTSDFPASTQDGVAESGFPAAVEAYHDALATQQALTKLQTSPEALIQGYRAPGDFSNVLSQNSSAVRQAEMAAATRQDLYGDGFSADQANWIETGKPTAEQEFTKPLFDTKMSGLESARDASMARSQAAYQDLSAEDQTRIQQYAAEHQSTLANSQIELEASIKQDAALDRRTKYEEAAAGRAADQQAYDAKVAAVGETVATPFRNLGIDLQDLSQGAATYANSLNGPIGNSMLFPGAKVSDLAWGALYYPTNIAAQAATGVGNLSEGIVNAAGHPDATAQAAGDYILSRPGAYSNAMDMSAANGGGVLEQNATALSLVVLPGGSKIVQGVSGTDIPSDNSNATISDRSPLENAGLISGGVGEVAGSLAGPAGLIKKSPVPPTVAVGGLTRGAETLATHADDAVELVSMSPKVQQLARDVNVPEGVIEDVLVPGKRYGAHESGPLSELGSNHTMDTKVKAGQSRDPITGEKVTTAADTFTGASYTKVDLNPESTGSIRLYRRGGVDGAYWSLDPPAGTGDQLSKALDPNWYPNKELTGTADMKDDLVSVNIPANAKDLPDLYAGTAGAQAHQGGGTGITGGTHGTNLPGGGNQVYLDWSKHPDVMAASGYNAKKAAIQKIMHQYQDVQVPMGQ